MKILVLGLDGATPEILLDDDRLANIRCLMEAGAYGRLESIVPPITVPAWLCLSTSRDPGSLGVYGFRNRVDRSYDRQALVESRTVGDLTIWDQVAREGKRSILVGVPPGIPGAEGPRRFRGLLPHPRPLEECLYPSPRSRSDHQGPGGGLRGRRHRIPIGRQGQAPVA